MVVSGIHEMGIGVLYLSAGTRDSGSTLRQRFPYRVTEIVTEVPSKPGKDNILLRHTKFSIRNSNFLANILPHRLKS